MNGNAPWSLTQQWRLPYQIETHDHSSRSCCRPEAPLLPAAALSRSFLPFDWQQFHISVLYTYKLFKLTLLWSHLYLWSPHTDPLFLFCTMDSRAPPISASLHGRAQFVWVCAIRLFHKKIVHRSNHSIKKRFHLFDYHYFFLWWPLLTTRHWWFRSSFMCYFISVE